LEYSIKRSDIPVTGSCGYTKMHNGGRFLFQLGSRQSKSAKHIRNYLNTKKEPKVLPNQSHQCIASFSINAGPQNGIWHSVFPSVQLPEIDLARYILDDLGKFGDRTAMVDAGTDRKISFAELQTQITKVASALSKMGVKQGDVLTMILPNCLEFPVLFLAANALGAIPSAVNPLYTSGELQHALVHSHAKVIITAPALLQVAREAFAKSPECKYMICTEPAEGCRPFSSLIEDDGKDFPDHIDIDPLKDIAALPYSSGTTGLPKGVMLSHYNIVSNIQQMSSPLVIDYYEGDSPAAVLPFFHIYGMSVLLLLSLKCGVKISAMPRFEPEMYLRTVQNQRCSHLFVVPPIVLFLAQHPMVDKYDLSAARSAISGAAPLSGDMFNKMSERINPNMVCRQGYGMTETSPLTHISPIGDVDFDTVGKVVPNTLGKVMNPETLEPMGVGQEGEICMKGPQVMLGYYNNPSATQNTITDDGWIRSGDLGFADERGFFHITDRMKELIKYKGLQVAPAELESLLISHPDIIDAAVIGIPDERAGELPRAFVVARPGATITEAQVANHVKDNVASYKQLSGGVDIRSEIPKSASGKILRRILKDEYLKGL